jgi:hypothetical protein
MGTPSYKAAIAWLAANDDCYWLGDSDEGRAISVTASLVADLWGKPDKKIEIDLAKHIWKTDPEFMRRLKGDVLRYKKTP